MSRPSRSAGFMLMMAIFMIVTMAAIAIYLLTISTAQVHATTQDEQGTKAYQAARAGIEWGAYRLLHDNSCPVGAQNIVFTAALVNFRAEVTCTLVGTETDGTANLNMYLLAVTACNNGNSACTPRNLGTPAGPQYVERQLQLSVYRTF